MTKSYGVPCKKRSLELPVKIARMLTLPVVCLESFQKFATKAAVMCRISRAILEPIR